MKVDIKNKEPKVLHRIPVLVASSAAPETWVHMARQTGQIDVLSLR